MFGLKESNCRVLEHAQMRLMAHDSFSETRMTSLSWTLNFGSSSFSLHLKLLLLPNFLSGCLLSLD